MINKKIAIKHTVIRRAASILGAFYPIKKKIVFSSFFGKQYSCNPKAISEKVHDMYPEYEIVWFINDTSDPYNLLPDYVRTVRSTDGFFVQGREIASSFCYVYNCELLPYISKKRNQLFVQTWHGDRGFKKVLHERFENGVRSVPVYDDKVTDICISGSEFGTTTYRNAFRYNGEIMQLGTPRNEKMLLATDDEKKLIRKKLGISAEVKTLMFAPTFRDNVTGKQKTQVDLERVVSILEEKGEKWVCLVRAHLASKGLQMKCSDERFIDATQYPDMTELLSVTDMLITDYSSCACDFCLTNKPIILATFDTDEYENNHRAFKVHPKESGFFVAENQEELEELLHSKTAEDYAESYAVVNRYYGTTETGKATEEICRKIDAFYKRHFGSNSKKRL